MNDPEDVVIVLSHDRHYRFHSSTLARNSTLFAELLSEGNAAKLSNKARNAGTKVRWMLELAQMPTDVKPAGELRLVELTTLGERADGRTGPVWNQNGRPASPIFTHYQSILYALYNSEIAIASDSMQAALTDSVAIIHIAEYLGCIPVIGKPIEVALVKHGQALYRAIAHMPAGWAGMAARIKSELIFREAVVHLVGNWARVRVQRSAVDTLRDGAPGVRALVEKYHGRLQARARDLELGLMSLYPGGMCTPSDDLPIKRDAYSKDILVWMALTFFRHWLGQRLVCGKGHDAADGGFALYRQVAAAGEAYMNKTVINQFHAKFPMTKKAMNVLENHLLEIKECMKGTVEKHGVLKSFCQLDVNRFPVDYLTCVEFESGDFPWLRRKVPLMKPVGGGVKRGRMPGGNEIVQQNLESARREQNRESSLDDEEELDGNKMFGEELAEGRNVRARYD